MKVTRREPARRLFERLHELRARSFSVFLLFLVVVCGFKVVADCHTTLGEVHALRMQVRERGENYVSVLSRPLGAVMVTRDQAAFDRLISGAFDDEEVVFLRIVDMSKEVIFERLDPYYARVFERERGAPFDVYYGHQLERDIKGIIETPDHLRARIQHSRHRDIPQAYEDLLRAWRLAGPVAEREHKGQPVLFEDRLYRMEDKESHDASVTWALGRLEAADGTSAGALVVGFDMRRVNSEIRSRYLKAAGVVLFFIALIVFRTVGARREKLRLIELEERYSAARLSLSAALPHSKTRGAITVAGALDQSTRAVDGVVFDVARVEDGLEVLLADPPGTGLDAAAVSLHVRAMYEHRRDEDRSVSLEEEVQGLADAARKIPGARERKLAMGVVRISESGDVRGLACGAGFFCIVNEVAGRVRPIDEDLCLRTFEGVAGPFRQVAATLRSGETLVIASGGTTDLDAHAVARRLVESTGPRSAAARSRELAEWARARHPKMAHRDIAIILVELAPGAQLHREVGSVDQG
jgi:hypothetical protein